MSFYNMLFGCNPNREIILALIGLKENDVERFRDCGIDSENKHIYIYTRTGGGNRDDYLNELLTNNIYYLYDEDDEYDCTYSTYYFKFPEDIEQDILDFLDLTNKGISAKLINRILEVFNRPETENDKYTKVYKEQMDMIQHMQKSFNISEAFNGHTILPLSDTGMERMLSVIEKNDGEFVAYWNFLPYKFKVMQNENRWSFDNKKSDIDAEKVRIRIDIIWEIDMEAWERYEKKFTSKYPKSIAKMKEKIENSKN